MMYDEEPKFWETTPLASQRQYNHVFAIYYYNIPPGMKNTYFDVALDWCSDQFGKSSDESDRWFFNTSHILFRDEIDAVAFKMRWC